MVRRSTLAALPLILSLLAGCQGGSAPTPKADQKPAAASGAEPEAKAALDKLSPDDRRLAGEQKSCPVTGEPLGSMGMPPKVTLKDQTVFLCCASCKKKAEADPDKTLVAVAAAKSKSGGK